MTRLARVLLILSSVAYPFIVVLGLLVFHAPARVIGLSLVIILVLNFLANSGDARKKGFERLRFWLVSSLLTILVAAIAITDSPELIKVYPILMNIFLLAGFSWTLIKPPTMIFRFASMQDKSLEGSPDRPKIEAYCRTVTIVWCGFFCFNASVATATAWWASEIVWSLYNGLISYLLIGMLLGGEFVVRRWSRAR